MSQASGPTEPTTEQRPAKQKRSPATAAASVRGSQQLVASQDDANRVILSTSVLDPTHELSLECATLGFAPARQFPFYRPPSPSKDCSSGSSSIAISAQPPPTPSSPWTTAHQSTRRTTLRPRPGGPLRRRRPARTPLVLDLSPATSPRHSSPNPLAPGCLKIPQPPKASNGQEPQPPHPRQKQSPTLWKLL